MGMQHACTHGDMFCGMSRNSRGGEVDEGSCVVCCCVGGGGGGGWGGGLGDAGGLGVESVGTVMKVGVVPNWAPEDRWWGSCALNRLCSASSFT